MNLLLAILLWMAAITAVIGFLFVWGIAICVGVSFWKEFVYKSTK
jgi:hypothetical protein